MKTVFDQMWGILLNTSLLISFPSSFCIILKKHDENNMYTSFLNSTELYVETDSIHQLNMYTKTVLY